MSSEGKNLILIKITYLSVNNTLFVKEPLRETDYVSVTSSVLGTESEML